MPSNPTAWTSFESGAFPLLPDAAGGANGIVAILATDGAAAAGWAEACAVELVDAWTGAGERIVLADLNLHGPTLHAELNLPNAEGISDFLLWGASVRRVARAVQREEGHGFYLISAGTAVADPAGALHSRRWAPLCEGFRRAGVTLVAFLSADAPVRDTVLADSSAVVLVAGETEDIAELADRITPPVIAVVGRPATAERTGAAAPEPPPVAEAAVVGEAAVPAEAAVVAGAPVVTGTTAVAEAAVVEGAAAVVEAAAEVAVEPERPEADSKTKRSRRRSRSNRTLLLAEDDDDQALLITRALERASRAPVEVHRARNGDEAVSLVRQLTPHLMILDLNMPGRSGHEVLEVVKGDDELRRIPVAVLTSSDRDEDVARSYGLGGNHFITKPEDPVELEARLRLLLKNVEELSSIRRGSGRLTPSAVSAVGPGTIAARKVLLWVALGFVIVFLAVFAYALGVLGR